MTRPPEPTHWRHPDFPTKAACGLTTKRFGNPPTCAACLTQKTAWDDDDEQTAVRLGLR